MLVFLIDDDILQHDLSMTREFERDDVTVSYDDKFVSFSSPSRCSCAYRRLMICYYCSSPKKQLATILSQLYNESELRLTV
jgi:hypothetical protein